MYGLRTLETVCITVNITQVIPLTVNTNTSLNSYNSFFEALKSMLLENAHKLYKQLLKEEVNTIISRYASDKSSSLLPTTIVTILRSEVRYFRDRFDI